MTEDATLSSFQDSEGDVDASEEPTNADAEPAISTYVWGTYTCDDCEETIARAWREDDELVCPSCKEW